VRELLRINTANTAYIQDKEARSRHLKIVLLRFILDLRTTETRHEPGSLETDPADRLGWGLAVVLMQSGHGDKHGNAKQTAAQAR